MHEDYYKSVFPNPVRILGLDLKPFSAGHIVLLNRIESPFITGGESDDESLAVSVAACSFNFREGIEWLNLPKHDFDKQMKKWRKRIGKVSMRDESAAFVKYLSEGSEFPLIYSAKESRGNSISNLAAVHFIRCRLMSYYGITSEFFWDMPWSLAQWDYFTIGVLEGTGDLVEKEVVNNAREFAEMDFRRMNPHLFGPDGKRKDEPCQN